MNNADSFYQDEALRLFQEGYQKQTEGAVEEAIELYKKSIDLFPAAETYTFLGWAYSAQGLYEEAIAQCRKAIQIDPDYGNPYNDIGSYMIEQGRTDEAIEWLEKAIKAKRYEAYCYPHYNLGRIWEKKGEWTKALRCYRDALIENSKYDLAKKAANRIYSMLN